MSRDVSKFERTLLSGVRAAKMSARKEQLESGLKVCPNVNCGALGKPQPLDSFRSTLNRDTGQFKYNSWCRDCQSRAEAQDRLDNPKKYLRYRRKYKSRRVSGSLARKIRQERRDAEHRERDEAYRQITVCPIHGVLTMADCEEGNCAKINEMRRRKAAEREAQEAAIRSAAGRRVQAYREAHKQGVKVKIDGRRGPRSAAVRERIALAMKGKVNNPEGKGLLIQKGKEYLSRCKIREGLLRFWAEKRGQKGA